MVGDRRARFDAAQTVLAELRTPLREPRTLEQLAGATGFTTAAVLDALAFLRYTHGVRRANLRSGRGAWRLPA